MTIPQLKARLSMAQVLNHYHLKPDKKHRLSCPFHDDRMPSMQVYYKTHTAYCFSGNCPTHGASLDVIDFVMHKEGCTKAEAIQRCKAMAGAEVPASVRESVRPKPMTELPRSAVLLKVFTYYCNAVSMTRTAQVYLSSRGLDYKLLAARGLGVGYNSGQMHHGERRDEYLIKSCLQIGLMSASVSGRKSRTGAQQYQVFGRGCLAFALKGRDGKLEGLYFRRVEGDTRNAPATKSGRHYYLRNRRGLWPKYPAVNAGRLLLVESIIDAASVLQNEATADGWEVLALYGTNGFTAEHAEAVARMSELEEVCLFLNGDAAGRKATEVVAAKVRELKPGVSVTSVPVPEGEDCNSLLVNDGADVLAHLIEERVAVEFSSSVGTTKHEAAQRVEEAEEAEHVAEVEQAAQRAECDISEPNDTHVLHSQSTVKRKLDTVNVYDLGYRAMSSELRVKGLRVDQLDTLKVTLQIRLA